MINEAPVYYLRPNQLFLKHEDPFLRYYPRKVDFWTFLNLNFYEQFDYLSERWLHKRGKFKQSFTTQTVSSFEEVEINLDDIVCDLTKQSKLIQRIYNERPAYLILGNSHMQALKIDLNRRFCMEFPKSYRAPLRGQPGAENMFAGMQIIFIPWMEGSAILPAMQDVEEDPRRSFNIR